MESVNKGILSAAFAKMCGISKETLRFYTSIGLIQPDQIDENGYRRYNPLQTANILLTRFMEQCGWSLSEIKVYLASRSEAGYRKMLEDLEERQQKEYQRLQTQMLVIQQMKKYLFMLENMETQPLIQYAQDPVTYLTTPFSRKMCSRETRLCDSNHNHLENCKHYFDMPVYPTGRSVERSQIEDGNSRYVKRLLSPLPNEMLYTCGLPQEALITVPPGLRVFAVHRGDVFSTEKTYKKILDFVKQNGLIIDGDAIELWIMSSFSTASLEDYCALIELPVRSAWTA